MESQNYPVEELVCDPRLQARREMSAEAIEDYRAAYVAKAPMPPIDVFQVGAVLYVVDGFHRRAAQENNGFLRARVVGTGSFEEAIWHSTGANQGHGLRRSNEDKRRSVIRALDCGIGAEQSSRTLAEHIGVSDKFVSAVRSEWEAEQTKKSTGDVRTDDTSPADDVRTVRTSPEKRRDSAGRMQLARKPKRMPLAAPMPPEDEPLPHEPTSVVPPYGAGLAEVAKMVRAARMRARALSLPNHLAQRFEAELDRVESSLRLSVPVECPRCHGQKCNHCQQLGWTDLAYAKGLNARDARQ